MELQDRNFLIYETERNEVLADVIIMDDTIWIIQKQMAELFEVDRPNIG